MDYNEALSFLYAQLPMFQRVGAAAYKPGLERVVALSDALGNPHRRFRAVHVAGTNGKGSVSHIIAATLQAAGYKTALYTSPHLVDFRERMRINGEMIPRERVVDFVTRWQKLDYTGDRPSFFELTMMMAFDWFAAEEVDIAVVEVGMGGRLDSTNIITPELSVITNISFDHTQFLGDTLAKIAAEKAGIIKPGVPVVVGEADAETEPVFVARAKEQHAPLRRAYAEVDEAANEALGCQLKGPYQVHNINTARVALEVLRHRLLIPDAAIREGFAHVVDLTRLQGRWQIINDSPLVIADTGHNEAGLSYNLRKLQELASSRLRFVLGFVADKDVDHILPLFPKDAVYYLTQAAIPRAMAVDDLAARASGLGFNFTSYPTVAEAYDAALADADGSDIIYVGGSTFIVADLLKSMSPS